MTDLLVGVVLGVLISAPTFLVPFYAMLLAYGVTLFPWLGRIDVSLGSTCGITCSALAAVAGIAALAIFLAHAHLALLPLLGCLLGSLWCPLVFLIIGIRTKRAGQ